MRLLALLLLSVSLVACDPETKARGESAELFVELLTQRLPAGWTLLEHSMSGDTLALNMLILNPRDLEFINLDRITQESMLFMFCPRRSELAQLDQSDFVVRVTARGANGDSFPSISCGN